MKLIPKYNLPFGPLTLNGSPSSFTFNLNSDKFNLNSDKFRLNDWSKLLFGGANAPPSEDLFLAQRENLLKLIEDDNFVNDNVRFLKDSDYELYNVTNPKIEMYAGPYNGNAGTYGYDNNGYTFKEVSGLKSKDFSYGLTTKRVFDIGKAGPKSKYFDQDAFDYYSRKLYENTKGNYKGKQYNNYDNFYDNWYKSGLYGPGGLRRNDEYSGVLSSAFRTTIPHYYIKNSNGEKRYISWGNFDTSVYELANENPTPNYQYDYFNKDDEILRGVVPDDIELKRIIVSKRLNLPPFEISIPKLEDIDIKKGLEENQERVKNRTSELEGKYPGISRWARKNGLSILDSDIESKYEQYKLGLNNNNNNKQNKINPFNILGLRVFLDNQFNTLNTEKLIGNLDVGLKNYTPIGRQVHGDYVSQLLAQLQASRLINNSPLTSNALILSAADMDAVMKGNQYILQGDAQDAKMYWTTSEQAFAQSKENIMKLDDQANYNRNALAEFNNKIAQMRWETNKQNMQNWDNFSAEQETELRRKQQVEEAKEIMNKEKFEALYDSKYGVGTLDTEIETLNDEISTLELKTNRSPEENTSLALKKKDREEKTRQRLVLIYLNTMRRNNWPLDLWSMWFPDFEYDPVTGLVSKKKLPTLTTTTTTTTTPGLTSINKYGGRLFLKGGGFGVSYTPVGSFSPYDLLYGKGKTASDGKGSSSSSSSSDDDSDEKTKNNLMKNIAETLKGVDGLDSDVNILAKELMNFFDYTKYSTDDDPTKFYQMYVKALTRVNLVKQSAKLFDSVYKELEKNNALNAPAIVRGGVYVGVDGTTQIKPVSVDEYLTNTDKYHVLTNGELLEMRRRNPGLAFKDRYLTETALNGTSIEQVLKYVKDFITNLGTDLESRDMLTRQVGPLVFQGLETLKKLVQEGNMNPETAQIITSLTQSLGEYNVSTSSQLGQVQLALKSVLGFMPENMRTLLRLYSGGKEEQAVLGLILQSVSSKVDFRINGFTGLDENGQIKTGSTKSGSGGSGGGSDKDPKETTATKFVQGYGERRDFLIIGGKNIGWNVSGNTLPITDSSEHNVGQTTLAELTRAFGGTLDLQHAVMGNSRISALSLNQVLVEDGYITMVALPLDPNSNFKRPWFDRMKLVSEAEAELRRQGILDSNDKNLTNEQKSKINQVYYDHKLPDKYKSDGSLDIGKYAYFGLVKGVAKDSSFEETTDVNENDGVNDREYLIKASDREKDSFVLTMRQISGDKKFNIDNGLWGLLGGEDVYRGTIFIPLMTNIHNTQSGFGSSYAGTPSLDIMYDTLLLKHDAQVSQEGGIRQITKTNFE